MRVLLFGKTGQVATEILRHAPDDVTVTSLGREAADLMQPGDCAEAVLSAEVDAVVNAAAWTAVDKAESEEDAARVVNGEAPFAMALAAARKGVPFVHVSTDYVFDGQGTDAFTPESPVAPRNAYGRTKLLGEEGVRHAGGRHVILRTSWVFSAHGANFVKTMLRLGREREAVDVVDDQVGGPTPAAAIADACLGIARALTDGAEGGTHHLSGSPDVSWADFARAIMEEAGLPRRVNPIPTSAWPTLAKRPLNSRMSGASLERAFGIARPDWRAGLRDVLRELGA
ncbi:dTDP-4-dehydrorhamnose reductase [Rubellimicrobium mesophilum DSM 19309]|uniref:dTDP-4-dehydrorhamnose reductase n=1 Tax=Rubellimicrobium mesophilum DSM 19309 TaxID=442562 RepID=A0A017HK18_9RHOB|nr:dTDP-4-dehydrorhamnose reductase [Rubellimicrobium mesophilum]EYD74104.1 dTDP-4-dehydrorhamnose reductase [Rubellimicrobium mesophilum DSM 19309]